MAKSVTVLADRGVHTLAGASAAPDTVVVLVVLGPSEISLHGSGDTDFRCDLIGRYTKLGAENGQAKTLCTRVHKEHVSTGIKGDRAPHD